MPNNLKINLYMYLRSSPNFASIPKQIQANQSADIVSQYHNKAIDFLMS